MNELKIQKYLRQKGNNFETLKTAYGINATVAPRGDLVNLKYNQIDSPKTKPIVRECRGIILEMDTWDIVSMAFYRFFNYGEDVNIKAEDLDHMHVMEKLDGSLISLFNYKGEWRMSTSGGIDNPTRVHDYDITFEDLFYDALGNTSPNWKELVDDSIVYIMELTAPENRVVTRYKERSVTLLACRRKPDFGELDHDELLKHGEAVNIPVAKMYNLESLEDVIHSFKDLPPLDEGYVAVNYHKKKDGNFQRVKIKNPTYVAKHHLKDSACNSRKALFGVVLTGEIDEVASIFEEFEPTLRDLDAKWIAWQKRHKDFIQKITDEEWSPKQIGTCAPDDIHTGFVFAVVNGKIKDIDDWVQNEISRRTFGNACKHIMGIVEK